MRTPPVRRSVWTRPWEPSRRASATRAVPTAAGGLASRNGMSGRSVLGRADGWPFCARAERSPAPSAATRATSARAARAGIMRRIGRRLASGFMAGPFGLSGRHHVIPPHAGALGRPQIRNPNLWGSGPLRGCERARQLAARADPELAVGAREVNLDGLGGHVEALGDVLVRVAPGGQLRNATLARGERLHPTERLRARPRPRGVELGAGALGERPGPASSGQLERLTERLPRVPGPPAPAPRAPPRGPPPCGLQLWWRP